MKISSIIRILLVGRKTPLTHATPKSVREVKGFILLANKYIENLNGSRGYNTVRNYITALRSFSHFLNGKDIPPQSITPLVMHNYERWLIRRGINNTTTSCYLRSLRVLYNIVSTGSRKSRKTPFAEVFTGNKPTAKRAAPVREMKKIAALDIPEDSSLQLARDIFLFSFYAMGMPFVDVVRLLRTQVQGEYIDYCRHKTGCSVQVYIEPCMRDILRRYEHHGGPYAFPVLPNSPDEEVLQHAYLMALNHYNRMLKRLAALAGIRHNLSSYVPRHTWATQAYAHKLEMPIISRALGHTNTQTTWTYVKQTGNGTLAKANKKIIKDIVKHTSTKKT